MCWKCDSVCVWLANPAVIYGQVSTVILLPLEQCVIISVCVCVLETTPSQDAAGGWGSQVNVVEEFISIAAEQ